MRNAVSIMIAVLVLTGCGTIGINGANKRQGTPDARFLMLIPTDAQPELVLDGSTYEPGLTPTEGPTWFGGVLYFSNYYWYTREFGTSREGGLIAWRPGGEPRVLNEHIQPCGTMAMANGNLAVCDILGHRLAEMTPDGQVVRTLADTCGDIPLDYPNDLVIDARGGIYFTAPRTERYGVGQPFSAICYLSPDGTVRRVVDMTPESYPNGCLLSPDGGTFYFTDSRDRYVWACDVLSDGMLGERRIFGKFALPDGEQRSSVADGMAMDTSGNLYATSVRGIQVFGVDGVMLGEIPFPLRPSNCIFGGPDRSVLYATCENRLYALKTTATGFEYPLK